MDKRLNHCNIKERLGKQPVILTPSVFFFLSGDSPVHRQLWAWRAGLRKPQTNIFDIMFEQPFLAS